MSNTTIKKNRRWLALAMVLFLISGLGASLVQSAGGSVEVEDLRWETPSGHTMSALLFKPDSATTAEPAPAVIVSHGWYNSREMQDLNFVELSRRGYVVISIDMYGHGNSDPVTDEEWPIRGTGMYDAVELVADLPYVDAERMGVTGHSNGGRAANWSVDADNEADEPLISAVLLVDQDPNYTDPETETGEYYNKYGSRDVGVIAAQYDEFFFRSYSPEGEILTAPRDYLGTDNAQSFLNFGASAEDIEPREAGHLYTEEVDGEEAIRVIYSLNQTHPWTHFSAQAVDDLLEFFDASLGTPNTAQGDSQVWQWKVFFNALGLVGFAIFLVAFTRELLQVRAFRSLRVEAIEPAQAAGRRGGWWFWGALTVSAVVSALSYIWLFDFAVSTKPAFLPQSPPYFIGVWAAFNGLFALLVMTISYLTVGRGSGQDLRKIGAVVTWRTLLRSVALAAIVVVAAFGIVLLVDYFFKTDFRLWLLTIRAFEPSIIGIALLYLPLFLVYFVANSVAVNSFNRYTLRGHEWLNTAVVALFNALGPIVLVVIQYTVFFATGLPTEQISPITGIWLFPVIVILAGAAVISRKIYRATNNPYIGGFITAVVATMMTVGTTLTIA